MPNQYTSEKKPLGELLSTTSPNIEVPEWQRNYSWERSYVETFWQDVIRFSDQYPGANVTDQEYFLGSIVLVITGTKHILLDGQQRLATATILLSVIRDHLKEYSADAATRTSQKYITDFDDATGTHSYKLTLNRYDREFFRREIQEEHTPDNPAPDPALKSHKLIRIAREFFWERFKEKYVEIGKGKAGFDWALRIRKVLTDHVSVVAVSSTDEDNAAAVFETLNDRGIGLSTPDLLRNLLLRTADEHARDEIIECWKSILEMHEEANVENFLRHYWLSQKGDVKTRSLYREIKQRISDEHIDSLTFSRDLQQAATIYRDIASGRDDDPDLQRLLESINMLGARSLMPAILSAYAVGNLAEKKLFLSALVSLYTRHNVIGGLENSKLENVVFNTARDLRHTRNFGTAIRGFRQLAPADDLFKEQFKIAQVERRDSARYVLREMEHAKHEGQEVSVETPDRVHVEHIYPLKPDHPWENHGEAVHRLGNLTLLAKGLNQTIRNSEFDAKKPYYEKSDLLITKELVAYEAWNTEAINKRQEEMSNLAVKIWTFAPEN